MWHDFLEGLRNLEGGQHPNPPSVRHWRTPQPLCFETAQKRTKWQQEFLKFNLFLILFKYTVLTRFRLEISEMSHVFGGFISWLYIHAVGRTAQCFATFASSEQPLADTHNCSRQRKHIHTHTHKRRWTHNPQVCVTTQGLLPAQYVCSNNHGNGPQISHLS